MLLYTGCESRREGFTYVNTYASRYEEIIRKRMKEKIFRPYDYSKKTEFKNLLSTCEFDELPTRMTRCFIFIYSLAFLKASFISCTNDSARSRDRATMTIFVLILTSKSESASIPAYGSDTRGTAVVCHQRGTPTPNNNTAKEMLA